MCVGEVGDLAAVGAPVGYLVLGLRIEGELRWSEPSAFISQTCEVPVRLLVKTIFWPFGEKAG